MSEKKKKPGKESQFIVSRASGRDSYGHGRSLIFVTSMFRVVRWK